MADSTTLTLTLPALHAHLLAVLAERWQEPADAIAARWVQQRLLEYRADRVRDLGIPPTDIYEMHVDGGAEAPDETAPSGAP